MDSAAKQKLKTHVDKSCVKILGKCVKFKNIGKVLLIKLYYFSENFHKVSRAHTFL